eukprot:COSAG02_NODE_3747_length_6292_cov_3.278379_2_plen_597_part_00
MYATLPVGIPRILYRIYTTRARGRGASRLRCAWTCETTETGHAGWIAMEETDPLDAPDFVATVVGGLSASKAAAVELNDLGCEVTDVQSGYGRVFFRSCSPNAAAAATTIERVSIVVQRRTEQVLENFLDFEGATQDEALRRVTDVVLAVDWARYLEVWSRATGKRSPSSDPTVTFKLSAQRTTRKKGKHLLPSNMLSKVVGGELARRFGWSVRCCAPDLEICLKISCEEFFVYIPTWVQRAGGQYLNSAGLHPCVAWAVARTLEIQPGDTVLDPMCGKGVLLCEAATNWPCASYLGCDCDAKQLGHARSNVAGAKAKDRIGLHLGDASMFRGLPLRDQSVDRYTQSQGSMCFAASSVCNIVCLHSVLCRVLTDLPFGKQFGTVCGNETLYPKVLAELARVMRPGGRAVILTSADNDATMQAALARVIPKQLWMEMCSKQTTKTESVAQSSGNTDAEGRRPSCSRAWEVVHRYGFMLFTSMRARIYVLRRTNAPAPSSAEAQAYCCANLDILRAWAHHSRLVRPQVSCQRTSAAKDDGRNDPEGPGSDALSGPDCPVPDLYVERLGGACSRLPWDDGNGWRKQWMCARPPMVVYSG